MKKTLVVIGLISLLALFSVSAWPFSSKGTEETALVPLSQNLLPSSSNKEVSSLTEEVTAPETPSTASTTTSDGDVVTIPRAEYEALLNEVAAGVEDMEDGHSLVSESAVLYEEKYNALMRPRYMIKAIGEWSKGEGSFSTIKAGFGFGALFSQKYFIEVGALKNDLSKWGKEDLFSLSGYTFSFGIGYIF